MTRLGLVLCALLLTACSTGLEPYADDDLEPSWSTPQNKQDASISRPDGGWPDAGRTDATTPFPGNPPWGYLDGSLPWIDGGFPNFWDSGLFYWEAGVPYPSTPPDASLPDVDFEYACDVYDVPVSCPSTLAINRACSAIGGAGQCPAIAGSGMVDWYACSGAPGPGARWSRADSSRCGYNCAVDLPHSFTIPIPTQGCRARGLTTCQRPNARTSQEGADQVVEELLSQCASSSLQLGLSFNELGCPSTVHVPALASVTPEQLLCLQRRLGTLRLDCDAPCAQAFGGIPLVPL